MIATYESVNSHSGFLRSGTDERAKRTRRRSAPSARGESCQSNRMNRLSLSLPLLSLSPLLSTLFSLTLHCHCHHMAGKRCWRSQGGKEAGTRLRREKCQLHFSARFPLDCLRPAALVATEWSIQSSIQHISSNLLDLELPRLFDHLFYESLIPVLYCTK